MRAFKISILFIVLVFALSMATQQAQADKVQLPPPSHSGSGHTGGSHGGSHGGYHGSSHGGSHGGYHGGYYGHGGHYGGYYPYWGGHYYGSHWGWGFGLGYYYPYYTWAYYPFYAWGWYPGYYWPYYYGSPYYGGYGYPGYYGDYYGYGQIRLEVKPKEAKVYVDGGYVGQVDDFDGWWQRLDIPAGKHRIVIREQGFAPYAETVEMYPGQDFKIKFQMQPGNDVINDQDMRLPPEEYNRGRSWYRDDQGRNRSPYGNRSPYNNPNQNQYGPPPGDQGGDNGQYQPEPNDQYQPNDQDRPDDRGYGQPPDNNRDDYSQPGQQSGSDRQTLVLQVQPRDATVYIDGNYYGTADVNESGELNILLAPGKHRVEVVRPGYGSYSKEVTVGGNESSRLNIQLEKK